MYVRTDLDFEVIVYIVYIIKNRLISKYKIWYVLPICVCYTLLYTFVWYSENEV